MLLSLLLNRYTWIAIILGVMSLTIAYERHRANGAEHDLQTVTDNYASFRAEVAANAAVAAKRAKEQEEKQDNATKEVRVDYEKTRTAVDTYYSLRMRDKPANPGGGAVPAAADSPQVADESAAECRAGYAGLERKAALDASQLQAWIDWAKAQGLPVE